VRFDGLANAFEFDVICKNLRERSGIYDLRKGEYADGCGVFEVELEPNAVDRLTDYLTFVKPDTIVEIDRQHEWIIDCRLAAPVDRSAPQK